MEFLDRILKAIQVLTGRVESVNHELRAGYQLQVKYLHKTHKGIEAPKKEGDVGYDLVIGEDILLPAHSKVPANARTFAAVKIPSGFWALVLPRSSANKKGIKVMPGTIDEGYTGELFSIAYNDTDEDVQLRVGDRIAQLVLMPRLCPEMVVVDKLPETQRGETGFGSTNKQQTSII